MPEPKGEEVISATKEMNNHKAPGSVTITAELQKSGRIDFCSEVHKLMSAVWKGEKLCEQWEEVIIEPIYKNKYSVTTTYLALY